MEVPVTKALHHHGEEPERAGYSIEELFTLIRSTSWRQKVLAMDTLAAILRKVFYFLWSLPFYDKQKKETNPYRFILLLWSLIVFNFMFFSFSSCFYQFYSPECWFFAASFSVSFTFITLATKTLYVK